MDIESEIRDIKERNMRVASDKAWETSMFRILVVAVVIYVSALLVLLLIGAQNVFVAGLVPAFGFLLSTQTFPPLKKWWIKTFWKGK